MRSNAPTDAKSHRQQAADSGTASALPSPPSVRDAEATRTRILDAAVDEFSENGLAGARIARIATRAHANQRMIYAYFTSKDVLFDAILERHVLNVQADIQLDHYDVATYATRVFDMYETNPRFARLELWQALERPGLAASLPIVSDAYAKKVALIEQGQRAGVISDAIAPAALLNLVLALVRSNISLSGKLVDSAQDRRRSLTIAVSRLVAPSSDSRDC